MLFAGREFRRRPRDSFGQSLLIAVLPRRERRGRRGRERRNRVAGATVFGWRRWLAFHLAI